MGLEAMIYYRIEKEKKGFRLCEPKRNPDYNRKTESVFAQCNGYLGVRASFETKQLDESRGTFVGGFYHRAGNHEVTELVNCPDVTEFRIRVNGEPVHLDSGKLTLYERSLRTRTGELVSQVGFLNGICIKTRRFSSMDNKKLFCHQLSITVKNGGILELSTGINGQITNSGVSHFDRMEARVFEKFRMPCSDGQETGTPFYLECGCDDGQTLKIMSLCCRDQHEVKEWDGKKQTMGLPGKKAAFHLERRSIYEDVKTELLPGQTWTLCKYTLYDTDGLELEEMAAILKEAEAAGYGELYRRHQEVFDGYWDMAAIEIEGAAEEEAGVMEFAQYHLAGMVPWDSSSYSVGAKGLTGEGYKGHVFWDTEIFIMPFFTLMFPEVSRNLLLYRYHRLEGARQKAEEYGYSGAMYPWESAVAGGEETPLWAAIDIHTGTAAKVWSGIKEHHVTADIIYALLNYYELTGDKIFMEQYGYQMILETAVFWSSRAVWNEEKGQLEIRDVIGPDEYTEHVDNNAYTNYMAHENVKAARKILASWNGELARQYRRDGWEKAFDHFLNHLYLPKPGPDHIIPQDDTFLGKPKLPDIEKYRTAHERQTILKDYSRSQVIGMQVLKQADVVMLLELLPGRFDHQTVKNNVTFYEALTLHDSSLSYCAHAEADAVIGEPDMAVDFFEKAMEIDLDKGYKDSAAGIHAASLGGIINCVLKGFAGIRVNDGHLECCPHLPKKWKSIRFSVMDHGQRKRVAITKNSEGDTEVRMEETGE